MKTGKTKITRRSGKASDPYKHHVEVDGSKRGELDKGIKRIRDADPTKTLELTLSLRGPELPSVDDLALAPLTPVQFRKKYCASPRDADKVAKVLKRYGFKVESTSLETRSMRVSGTIAAAEAAFHARLGIYKGAQGEFRDREHHYKLPPGLDGIITAVLGLGQRRVAKKRLAAGRGGRDLRSVQAGIDRRFRATHAGRRGAFHCRQSGQYCGNVCAGAGAVGIEGPVCPAASGKWHCEDDCRA